MNRFKSMKELENVTVENEDWEIETDDKDSNVSILAIHGGGIEPATTELAQVIADKGNFNYFSFKGLRSKGNNELHVTSTNYDDPQAIKIVEKSERAIALHGCKGEDSVAYIGGNDQQLIDILSDTLSDVGIKVQEAPNTMAGKQDENIINLTKNNAGVQIELTSSLRKELFVNNKSSRKSREDRDNWGDLMYDFADATIKALQQV